MSIGLLLLLFVGVADADVPMDMPSYIIDLDRNPIDRWSLVMPNFADPIREFNDEIRSRIPRAYIDVAEVVASRLDQHIPQPYQDELQSIAKACSISLADIVLVNLIYELRTYCTSVLVRTPNNTILHGRNLDYDLNTDLLRRLTFRARFVRSNSSSFTYESIHFAGSLGLLTSSRSGHFSLSINQRETGDSHWWMNALMSILHLHAMPLFLFTRLLFDNPALNYNQLKSILQTQHLIAPIYFILTDGLIQGSIITRNRLNTINTIELNSTLVQTNYDHWLIDPRQDPRRTTAENVLTMLNSSQLIVEQIFDPVLSVIPVLNRYTVYTAIMNPSSTEDIFAKIRTFKLVRPSSKWKWWSFLFLESLFTL